MKFKYDAEADAIYIYLSEKPYAYGTDLDDERRIDYASDNTPIGVELLCVSDGVNLDGLPYVYVDEIAEVLEAEGINIYVMGRQPSITWQGYSNMFNWQDHLNMFNVTEGTEKHTSRLKKEKEEVTV